MEKAGTYDKFMFAAGTLMVGTVGYYSHELGHQLFGIPGDTVGITGVADIVMSLALAVPLTILWVAIGRYTRVFKRPS